MKNEIVKTINDLAIKANTHGKSKSEKEEMKQIAIFLGFIAKSIEKDNYRFLMTSPEMAKIMAS